MAFFTRIRTKLLLAFLAVTAIPIAAVAIYGSGAAERALSESAIRSTEEAVHLAAERLDRELYLSALTTDLTWRNTHFATTAALCLGGGGPDAAVEVEMARRNIEERVFAERLANVRGWRRMWLLRPDTSAVIRVEKDAAGQVHPVRTPSHGPPFLRAKFLRPGTNLTPWRDEDGMLLFTFSVPLLDRESGRPVGVLAVDLSISQLIGEELATGGKGATRFFLLTGQGEPVARMFDPEIDVDMPDLTPAEQRICLGGKPGAIYSERQVILAYAPVDPHLKGGMSWYLVRETPASEILASVDEFRLVFGGLLAGSLLAACLLAFMLSRQLTRPLTELRDGARTISEGNLEHRIEPRAHDEVGQVADEFNRMASRLGELYEGMERTIENKTAALRVAYAQLECDFEERKQLEAQLIQAEKLSSIGTLASSLAHEINNPIGIISMYAQMLEEKGRRGEVDTEKLHTILEQSRRVAGITRNLLDFARGRQPEIAAVDLREVVSSTVALVDYKLEKSGISTEISLPADTPVIQGDAGQLSQVALNMILNAEHAMRGGGRLTIWARSLRGLAQDPELTVGEEVRAGIEAAGPLVELGFKDTGCGIPADHLVRLFEPFFTTKGQGVGTGLGLAVSQGIVRSHGGTILVESEPGRGTTFRILLPVGGPTPEQLEAASRFGTGRQG